MVIRAAAFDLDGTLVDTVWDLAAALNQTLLMLGAPELAQTQVKSLIGAGVERLVAGGLRASLGVSLTDAAQIAAALAVFRRNYARAGFRLGKAFPGVPEGLNALSAAGVALCCITNKDRAFSEPLLEQAGLAGFFDFILCAQRPEDRKPSPNMLLAACARFAVAPAEMLYVGDSTVDIAAARAAGCPIIAVTYGYDQELRGAAARPDAFIRQLPDLMNTGLQFAAGGPRPPTSVA
jgi:phosphoglycolate phosphatase